MIPLELEGKILRLYHAEKWKINTIATHIGVHHSTVRRVLAQEGMAEKPLKASIADPYIPFIMETLKTYPKLTAKRLWEMIRERGYPGGVSHFRYIVSCLRPRPRREAYLRLRTLPGEQAQVDWAHFGKIPVGNAQRPLMGFCMVLSWSRQIFLRFFLGSGMSSFLKGHVEAFTFYGGVPRVVLYDNLKSAVLERIGDAIRFHPTLLELAAHYRYEPRPVAIARGNEKGRVERAIRYIRDAFFAARGFESLSDLNRQALEWCEGASADRRCPEDLTLSVRDAFSEEKKMLICLPDDSFPCEERAEVEVGKTPYIRFDLNDYSVPHGFVEKTLVVFASEERVRILDGSEVVAVHDRSYDKGSQIEDPSHVAELEEYKREAREGRGMDRLYRASPSSRALLIAAAERGLNIGTLTCRLLGMVDQYGAQEIEESIKEALSREVFHLSAIRQILDQRLKKRGVEPPISVNLPDDPRVRGLVVKPHDLKSYDCLRGGKDEK